MPDETTETSPLSQVSQASQTTPPVTSMSLAGALAALDPANDADWTADGRPRIEALEALVGAAVTQEDVDQIAPDLRRDSASNSDTAAGTTDLGTPLPTGNPIPTDLSHHERISRLEEELAFLRSIFGWPTKS